MTDLGDAGKIEVRFFEIGMKIDQYNMKIPKWMRQQYFI